MDWNGETTGFNQQTWINTISNISNLRNIFAIKTRCLFWASFILGGNKSSSWEPKHGAGLIYTRALPSSTHKRCNKSGATYVAVQFQFQGDIQPLLLYIMELEVITMLYYLFKPRTAPPSTRSHWFLLKNSAKKTIWRIASLLIMCICSKCGTINIAWFKPSNVLPNDHSICGPLDRPVVSGRPAAKTKLRPEHCWGHPRHRHPKVHQRKGVRKFVTS